MRVLLQRVTQGRVTVAGEVVGAIDRGYVVLVGVAAHDTPAEADWLAQKILELRLFPDDSGKFDRAISEVAGGILVVSQFTLYADVRRGRRPSFSDAAAPEVALGLYEHFAARLRASGLRVETGRFGADMRVEIHNDGPVTIWLERDPL